MQTSVSSTCIVNQSPRESQTSPPVEYDHPKFPQPKAKPKSVSGGRKISLKNETDYLSREYITYRCQEEGILITCSTKSDYVPSKNIEEVLTLLKKQCYKYEKQYENRLKVCCEKLRNCKSNASRNFFDVAKELFSQNIKWEHLIILITFSGRLAIDYVHRDMIDCIECLIGWLSIFLCDRLGDWILTHDGWVSSEAVCVHVCVCV